MHGGKGSSKGSKMPSRPANRVMGSQISGQRRANAIDAVVERAQRGNRDEVRERDIVRR